MAPDDAADADTLYPFKCDKCGAIVDVPADFFRAAWFGSAVAEQPTTLIYHTPTCGGRLVLPTDDIRNLDPHYNPAMRADGDGD